MAALPKDIRIIAPGLLRVTRNVPPRGGQRRPPRHHRDERLWRRVFTSGIFLGQGEASRSEQSRKRRNVKRLARSESAPARPALGLLAKDRGRGLRASVGRLRVASRPAPRKLRHGVGEDSA